MDRRRAVPESPTRIEDFFWDTITSHQPASRKGHCPLPFVLTPVIKPGPFVENSLEISSRLNPVEIYLVQFLNMFNFLPRISKDSPPESDPHPVSASGFVSEVPEVACKELCRKSLRRVQRHRARPVWPL